MMDLLVFKERLRKFYQQYQSYIEPALKFFMSLFIFLLISNAIGFDPRLKHFVLILGISVIGAFAPFSILVLLAAIVSVGHVFYISKILSIIIIFIYFILYFLFARFTPKQGIVILAIPVLFLLKIPYFIPLFLGLVATPMAIISTSCGVIVYYLFFIIKEATLINTASSLEDTLQIYTYVLNSLVNNKQLMLTLIVFAIVITVTYLVRRMQIDHVYEIAIIAGSAVNIIIFLIGDLKLDISKQILGMIIGTIVSAALVYIVHFFKITLDYTRVEKTQFEDDDYYYYVKAVPKITVTEPKKDIKKINSQKVTENTINIKAQMKNEKLGNGDMKSFEVGEDEDFDIEDLD